MKKLFILVATVIFLASCNNTATNKVDENKSTAAASTDQETAKPIYLTEATFKTSVFDFTSGKEWKYVGNKPCIIDFYADWCGPCKRLAPVMEELAAEYKDQIYIYKVNTDQNPNVSAFFNIDGIPAVFFIPMTGESKSMVGLNPKEEYVKAIQTVLLKK